MTSTAETIKILIDDLTHKGSKIKGLKENINHLIIIPPIRTEGNRINIPLMCSSPRYL